jgi:hypothetical protein
VTYYRQYYVTFSVNPSGSGTINQTTGWFGAGKTYGIEATAASGFTFSSWTSSNPSITFADSTSATTTVTIDLPGTVTADFS